jgi:hypothetical protein
MPAEPDDIRATLEAGRHAVSEGLRQLADRIETIPLDQATDALDWLRDTLTRIGREAERVFRGS